MLKRSLATVLVTFDKWSWYFFIVWFALALTLQVLAVPTARSIAYWGVVLVLINNMFRLLLVAEQFRQPSRPQYRRLTYVLLLILIASVAVQFLIP